MQQKIEKEIRVEIISEEKVDKLRKNTGILQSAVKTVSNIKEENSLIRKSLSVQDLKLGWLSKELENIQNQNNNIQIEIKNKVELFNALKTLINGLTLKGEYFEILANGDFNDSVDILRIEEAIEIFSAINFEYSILAVEKVHGDINECLNEFCKRFRTYLNERFESFVAKTTGKLEVHKEIFESIATYKNILEFLSSKEKPIFDEIFAKYKTSVRNIYRKEVDIQLSVLKKSIYDKENLNLRKILSLFLESIFLILKFESDFLKNIFQDDEGEGALDIFRDVFHLILKYFQIFLSSKEFNFICALNQDFNFNLIGETEQKIPTWDKFVLSLESYRNSSLKAFLTKVSEECKTHSRISNLDSLIKNLKFCRTNKEKDPLISIYLPQINKGDNKDLEDNIYTLNLLFKLKIVLNPLQEEISREEFSLESIIEERLNQFEQSVTHFIFSSEQSKIFKKVKNILELMDSNLEFIDNFKEIVFENLEDADKSRINELFNHVYEKISAN